MHWGSVTTLLSTACFCVSENIGGALNTVRSMKGILGFLGWSQSESQYREE